jgi:two-component system OmpR family sensor kinase
VRRLSGFTPTKRVPWEVIVGIPTDAAYSTLRRELWNTLARLVAAGLAAGLVAWMFSRRLSQPIRKLAAAARAYTGGDLAHRVAPGGPEELVALGNTLGRMAEALQQQMVALTQAHRREREAGERALVELRRLHSEFVAVAAHELRTPVAAARSYAELLLRDDVALPAATRRQALTRLNSVCERLSRLVRSLLSASRIQAGGLEIGRLPVDLLALVARVVEEVAASSPAHDIQVRARPAGVLTAVGDAERIEDVLVNLLVNATKYSPAGSVVYVDVVEAAGWVEVVVVDQGTGIPEAEQDVVFERFTRGSNVAGAGMGLGLYIARAYVEAMGGVIGVRSAPGQGAAFWFRLPRAQFLAPVAQTMPAEAADKAEAAAEAVTAGQATGMGRAAR